MTAEQFDRAVFLDRDIQQIARQLEYWNKAVRIDRVQLDDIHDREEGYTMTVDVALLPPFETIKEQAVSHLRSMMDEMMREFEAL